MHDNETILAAVKTIEDRLPGQGAAAVAIDPAALCQSYRAIRGSLEILLAVVEKIPVYGAPIAAAIKLLMSIADQLCPSH